MITFTMFGAQHVVAVGLAILATALAVGWGRRQTPERAAQGGKVIGAVLLAWYLAESVVRVGWLGVPLWQVLPFELCNAVFFLGPFAYFSGKERAFEVVYYWTFAGTLHSLITPTPRAGFPDPNYFQYFIAHGLLILSASYVALAMRRGTSRNSVFRAFLMLQVFVVLVGVIDAVSGRNYFYLREKPPSPTLLDALGPWPWYLVTTEVVALASFLLWSLPFAIHRRYFTVAAPRLAAAR